MGAPAEDDKVAVVNQSVELVVVVGMVRGESDPKDIRLAYVAGGVVAIHHAAVDPAPNGPSLPVDDPYEHAWAAEFANVGIWRNFHVSRLTHFDYQAGMCVCRRLGESQPSVKARLMSFGGRLSDVVAEFANTAVRGVGASLALGANDKDMIGKGARRNRDDAKQKHLLKHNYLSNVQK